MRTFAAAIQVARNLLWNDQAWLWFCEIEASDDRAFRLVRSTRHVAADGKTWQATSFDVQASAEDADGSLGECSITIPDVSRLIMGYAEGDDELYGRALTLTICHEASLEEFTRDLQWRHVIESVEITEAAATLRCRHPAEDLVVPGRRYSRRTHPQLLPAAGLGLTPR